LPAACLVCAACRLDSGGTGNGDLCDGPPRSYDIACGAYAFTLIVTLAVSGDVLVVVDPQLGQQPAASILKVLRQMWKTI
jgi:hypothetical protein